MNNEQNELISILKTAIELESKGLRTFLEFAKKTKNIAGKNMFIQLALDEQKHWTILEEQMDKLVKGKTISDIEIPTDDIEKILPKIGEKIVKTKGESGTDDIDALNAALDLESKASEFFKEKAEQVSNPEIKKLLLELSEWELRHYKIIDAELNAIQQTGFWFDVQEFMMDGKV